jgi:hypothetical protein
MYKLSAFSLALFFSTVAVAQQSTATKSSESLTPTDVEISSVAIPMEQAGNVIIDYSTYHKEVHLGPEPESSMQTVEVSAPAIHVNEHAPSQVSKVVTTNEADNRGKESINKSDRAQRAMHR